MADRVAVMDDGRVQQVATPVELYRRPANRFVADFIGTEQRVRGRPRRPAGLSVGGDGRCPGHGCRGATSSCGPRTCGSPPLGGCVSGTVLETQFTGGTSTSRSRREGVATALRPAGAGAPARRRPCRAGRRGVADLGRGRARCSCHDRRRPTRSPTPHRRSYWQDLHDGAVTVDAAARRTPTPTWSSSAAGFTGLWTAITAKRRDPGRDVVVLEASARRVRRHRPQRRLRLRLADPRARARARAVARRGRRSCCDSGSENLAGSTSRRGGAGDRRRPAAVRQDHGRDHGRTRSTALPALREAALAEHGEDVGAARRRRGAGRRRLADVPRRAPDPQRRRDWSTRSRWRSGCGTGRCGSGVRAARADAGLVGRTRRRRRDRPPGAVRAEQVLLATNAFPPPLRRLRKYVVPGLGPRAGDRAADRRAAGRASAGRSDQGRHRRRQPVPLLPAARRTAGSSGAATTPSTTSATAPTPAREQRDASHRLLARQFFETFPQLDGRAVHPPLGGHHRHLEPVHAVLRRRPRAARSAYAVGYTGLGRRVSRFGAPGRCSTAAGRDDRAHRRFLAAAAGAVPARAAALAAVQSTRRGAGPRGPARAGGARGCGRWTGSVSASTPERR